MADPAAAIFLVLLIAGAAIAAALAFEGRPKKPCTCPECRPDLHPEVIAQLDQKAAYDRAQARALEAATELKMKQAEHDDVARLLNDMKSRRR